MAHVSTDNILAKVPGSGGVVRTIAKRVGLSRSRLYARIRDEMVLQDAVAEERESMLDTAEHHLFRYVQQGKEWAIKYVLSRLGKERGYTTSMKLDANVERVGKVIVYLPDNGRDRDDADFDHDEKSQAS